MTSVLLSLIQILGRDVVLVKIDAFVLMLVLDVF